MHSRHLAGHVLPPHGNRVNVDRHCCTSKLSARSRTPLWRATTSTTQEFYRILWNRNLDSIQFFELAKRFAAWFKQLLKVNFSWLWRSEKCCARSRLVVFKFIKTKEPNSWYFRHTFYWNNHTDKIYGYNLGDFVLINLKTTKRERARHFSECQS